MRNWPQGLADGARDVRGGAQEDAPSAVGAT